MQSIEYKLIWPETEAIDMNLSSCEQSSGCVSASMMIGLKPKVLAYKMSNTTSEEMSIEASVPIS